MKECLHTQFDPSNGLAEFRFHKEPGNILDLRMLELMRAKLRELRDLEPKALWVYSFGSHFCFGADISEHFPGVMENYLRTFHDLVRELLEFPAPSVLSAQGCCLGGGFELALACDLIICQEKSRFALPEVSLGVFPPVGACLLPVKLGSSRATEMILTGTEIQGSRVHELGLAATVLPEEDFDESARRWIQSKLLCFPRAALRAIAHSCRWKARRAIDEELLELEERYRKEVLQDPEALEGLRAFLEKRTPQWKNVGYSDAQ